MAHYKDGTEAKVGDLVKGVTYNRAGRVVVGEVIQISPAHDACNVIVLLPGRRPIPSALSAEVMRLMHEAQLGGRFIATAADGIANGKPDTPFDWFLITGDCDYGQTDAFELVHRPDA